MQMRVVVYGSRGAPRVLAERLAKALRAEICEIRCPRYHGVLGRLRAVWDRLSGRLPDIEVTPPIGPADALVVGGPVRGGCLAAPVRQLLSRAAHLPPVVGVFATRVRPGSGFCLEETILSLPVAHPPEHLTLLQDDLISARGRNRIATFLEALMPIRDYRPPRPLFPAVPPLRIIRPDA